MHNPRLNYLSKIGLLSAVATLLIFLETPVPMMPVFLKLDISDLPAVIAAFALGPAAAILVALIKNMLHLLNTQTLGIGECADFLVGAAFLLPVGYIYQKYASYRGAVLALAFGTVAMIASAAVLNYYFLLPLYQAVLHFPIEQVVALGSAANPHITSLKTFITLAIIPFNATKGVMISLLTMLIYKKVLPLLHAK